MRTTSGTNLLRFPRFKNPFKVSSYLRTGHDSHPCCGSMPAAVCSAISSMFGSESKISELLPDCLPSLERFSSHRRSSWRFPSLLSLAPVAVICDRSHSHSPTEISNSLPSLPSKSQTATHPAFSIEPQHRRIKPRRRLKLSGLLIHTKRVPCTIR